MQQGGQCRRSRGIAQQQGGHVIRCVFWKYLFDVFHIFVDIGRRAAYWLWDGVPPIGFLCKPRR
jgi:hypothetical protein